MNIVYIHQYFAFPDANTGVRSYDLSSVFIKSGYNVTVVTSSAFLDKSAINRRGWNVIYQDGLTIHAYNSEYSNKMGYLKRIFKFLDFMIKSSFKVLSLKADVVLSTSTPLTVAIPALFKKFIHKVPYIFEVRDVWPELPIAVGAIKSPFIVWIAKKIEQFTYNQAKHIVVLSSGMKLSISRRLNVNSGKITVITNIANINRFNVINRSKNQNGNFSDNYKVISYIGTFGIINNVSYLVYLAKSLLELNSDIKIFTYGDGMEKEKVVSLAKKEGVYNINLFFRNPISKSKVPNILMNVDACISLFDNIPEMWSNSANKYFDALAAGKPIIINYKGWQADEIGEEKIGLILSEDFDKMKLNAELLNSFMSDRMLLQEYGKNALTLAERKYSLEVLSNKYLGILECIKTAI